VNFPAPVHAATNRNMDLASCRLADALFDTSAHWTWHSRAFSFQQSTRSFFGKPQALSAQGARSLPQIGSCFCSRLSRPLKISRKNSEIAISAEVCDVYAFELSTADLGRSRRTGADHLQFIQKSA
jgi:hypothetical protein